MPAEAIQEQGRRGVAMVKRWLEATTFVELPWNAYENPSMCELELLAGIKRVDLAGYFLGDDRRPVVVENKDYSSDGGQYTQFQEFLSVAYSSTARILDSPNRTDPKREFVWVTTHPFAPLSRWSSLASANEVLSAVGANPGVLGDGHTVDTDVARIVAERVWVLVMNKKQEKLSLTSKELAKVHKTLKRKEPTL